MEGIQVLLTPFVWILMLFYQLFSNYGVSLILFALLVKLILFPFSLKGKRSMIQMNMLSAEMQKIQKRCGQDKERYNLEVQKLYAKEKVNPMGGCLWSMLPVLVLLPLYAIIRQPITYLMNVPASVLGDIAKALDWNHMAVSMGWLKETAEFTNGGYNQLYLSSLITPENVEAVKAAVGSGAEKLFSVNFNFLGMNLSQVPQWNVTQWTGVDWNHIGLLLLPIVSALTSVLFSVVSMKTNAINKQSAQAANNPTNKIMYLISPLMSLWIGFSMPAALSIYWISQNVLSLLQEYLASKMLKKDYEKAAAEQARREAEEKEEEKRQKEREREERARRIEESKQSKGKKKPGAAKKKDPEDDKIPQNVKEASRVGIRAYARGRAYDPCRFSPEGATPYGTPSPALTQESELEKDFQKESEELEQVALEKAADDLIVEELAGERAPGSAAGAEEDGEDFETPAYEAPGYDKPDYDGEDDKKE